MVSAPMQDVPAGKMGTDMFALGVSFGKVRITQNAEYFGVLEEAA